MAESLMDIENDPEKNFILAKLVSLYGDIVDFDVISLVAQENGWNEERCVEVLKVLGDYRDTNAVPKCSDDVPRSPIIVNSASLNKQQEPSKKSAVEVTSQHTARSYTRVAATEQTNTRGVTKTANMAGNIGHAQGRTTPIRQLSPSSQGMQKSVETQEHHDKVKELIKSGVPVLILLRGLPGSGKSTLAKNLLTTPGARGSIHSTDEFFHVPRGGKGQTLYQYDPLRLGEAHEWNRVQVLRAIAHGVTPIIVDNTNVQKWEMLPYVEMALEPWEAESKLRKMAASGSLPKNNICSSLGPARPSMIGKKCSCGFVVGEVSKVSYEIELLEPLTWWYRNPARLAKVNQHGVSQKKITQMLSNFEFNVTGEKLVNHVLKNKSNNPAIIQRDNVRPSNQSRKQAATSGLSGSPIFSIAPPMPAQGNQFGVRPRHMFPPNVGGNHPFNPYAGNQFQPLPRYPPVPHPRFPPSLLSFPVPPPPVQALPFKNQFCPHNPRPQTLQQHVEQKIQDKPKEEDFNMSSLTNQSSFSKSASNISLMSDYNKSSLVDSLQPKEKCQNWLKGSLATSETNIHEKSSEAVSFVGSECKEMTEEELDEWTKNNSMWGWESSDDESEDGCKVDADEPKPERVLKLRHKDNLSEKGLRGEIIRDETSQKSKDDTLDNRQESEWVIKEDDPLISWDTPEVINEKSKEEKSVGPLPPRNSKRKRLLGNVTDPDDSPEEENKNSILDMTGVAEAHELHSLLGKFEDLKINRGLDFQEEISMEKADGKCLIPEKVESFLVLEDLAQSKNFDSTKACDILVDTEAESSVKLGVSSSEDPAEFNSLKPEICSMKTESILIEIGTDKSGSINEAENLKSESVFKDLDNKDQTLLTNSSEIMPTKTDNAAADASKTPTDNKASKQEVDPIFNQNNSKDSKSISSPGVNKQNEMTPENLMLLAPLIKEGLQWFDNEYKRRGYNEKGRDYFEKKDDVNVIQPSACDGETPVHVAVSSSVVDSVQDSEESNSGEHGPTSHDQEKTQLMENSEVPDRNQCSENIETTTFITPCETDLIEIKETSVLSEISHTVPSNLEIADAVSLETAVSSHDLVECEGGEIEIIQNFETISSKLDLLSGSNISPVAPEIKTAQEIMESNTDISTSDNEVTLNDSYDTFPVEKEMQPCIPSACVASDPLTIDHPCEKVDLTNSADPSDVKSEPKEQTVSLLEILENLRKKKLADKAVASVVDPVVIEKAKETSRPEKVGEAVDSEAHPYPLVSGKSKDSINVSDLSEICINKEEESSVKTEKEDVTNQRDWSELFEDEGDTVDVDDESETFPLVLDPNFIKQICQKFGNPYQESMDESSKFSSGNNNGGITVQVPANLARKLHECWLKTQWNTILDEEEASQKMVIEDEMLAHQLQALEEEELKEKREHKSSNTPNLREIMDMEMAMAIYKADQNRSTETPQKNDLSTRLSWDMLTKEFPHIPQDIITEVFSAYNFSYESAREALVASLPDIERSLHDNKVKDVVSPEILAAQEKALIEKAKLESLKSKEPHVEVEEAAVESEDEGSWEAQVDQARRAASLNRRLQKERHAQAQAASRSGIPSAAAYYCRMASLHKQKADEANRKAANILSRVFTGEYNSKKGINADDKEITQPPMTLDMHSMTVLEALRVLNAFLDAHAEYLRNGKRKNSQSKMVTLFLITGRGSNSLGGIPRIKPAVEKQLEKRGVWYEELNPGLLRVMVSSTLSSSRKL